MTTNIKLLIGTTANQPRMTKMNSIQWKVLEQLTLLIKNQLMDVVPVDVIYRIVWEVALLGEKLTRINYRDELHSCIVATLKDEIYQNLLGPYLDTKDINVPDSLLPMDILDMMSLLADLYNIKDLTDVYNSLASLSYDSPYYKVVHDTLERLNQMRRVQ
ncbi:hypothetical protein LI410_mgp048 (mitochondrion) [Apium graveolens]|uniref:hypothetical protein n=1 Tax=Apium graveolens TaxID=4045 RepID=UPI001D026919|nr:hypothetical protein LI410_mgp132 [Apium graveolens]YP_010185178.1 hypothetical protein LI410_mgp048 [Apium graveolens]QVJ97852.1 hypothetical protein [Apium graveolens]QVJ97935.1 hypothetical protein [Apium graveolens]